MVFRFLFSVVCFLVCHTIAFAQCAMCRATVDSNQGMNQNTIADGLNFGILYLMAIPYVLLIGGGVLFYRHLKSQSKQKSI